MTEAPTAHDAPVDAAPPAALAPTRLAGEVTIGEELPTLAVPVSATLIVAGALATRDFEDIHHDREAAHRRGAPDIRMSILTTMGLVERYVTDWAGPEALVRGVSARFGTPNHPGDTMTLSGRVAGRSGEGGYSELTVEVRGTNSLGDHVTATVRISLPGTGT